MVFLLNEILVEFVLQLSISKLDALAEIMDGPIITNGLNLICVITVTFQIHFVITHTSLTLI